MFILQFKKPTKNGKALRHSRNRNIYIHTRAKRSVATIAMQKKTLRSKIVNGKKTEVKITLKNNSEKVIKKQIQKQG